ncbi:MAG: DUF4926 domain-containing protein [Caldilineae bacterium]|nr:DUF4926 domain-containing protein [Caldilineae bacterium]
MKPTVKLLDVVALTDDLPEYNLLLGQVGTVVEVLGDGSAFEVEFSDRQGRTYESVGRSSGLSEERAVSDLPASQPKTLSVLFSYRGSRIRYWRNSDFWRSSLDKQAHIPHDGEKL